MIYLNNKDHDGVIEELFNILEVDQAFLDEKNITSIVFSILPLAELK